MPLFRYRFLVSLLAFSAAALVSATQVRAVQSRVIAVLYFDNNTGDPAFDVLQKGFADMMITDLSGVEGVTVVEREKLQALIDEIQLQKKRYFDKKTAIKLGKGLGARYAVTGSFQAMKPSLRMDVRLIDIKTGAVVVATKVQGRHEDVFALEQQLVARFVAGMKKKFEPRRRAFTRVTNVDLLLEYSRGVDLADKALYEDAFKIMATVVHKAPAFALARVKRDEYTRRIKAAGKKRREIVVDYKAELAKKTERYLAGHDLATLAQADAKIYIAYRVLRGRFIVRALSKYLSDGRSVRVVKRGHEAKAQRLMKAYYANGRLLIDELALYAKRFTRTLPDGAVSLDTWFALPDAEEKQARDAGLNTSLRAEPGAARRMLGEFVLLGEARDLAGRITVSPPLAESGRSFMRAGYELLQQAWAEADAQAQSTLYQMNAAISALQSHAEALLLRGRHDQALAKMQEILDRYPTAPRYDFHEKQIKKQLGLVHDATVVNLENYAQGLKTCKDMALRKGLSAMFHRRMRLVALRSVDRTVAEIEKHCRGNARAKNFWTYLYAHAATTAGRHDDCEMFDRYIQRYLNAGGSKSSAVAYRKNYSGCRAR